MAGFIQKYTQRIEAGESEVQSPRSNTHGVFETSPGYEKPCLKKFVYYINPPKFNTCHPMALVTVRERQALPVIAERELRIVLSFEPTDGWQPKGFNRR